MEKREMDDKMKKLLVAGLNNFEWDSLSLTQLITLVRLISTMESVNWDLNMNESPFGPLIAKN